MGIGYLRNLEDIGVLYTKRKGSVLNQRVGFHCVVLVLSLNWLMTSVSCIQGEKRHWHFRGMFGQETREIWAGGLKTYQKPIPLSVNHFRIPVYINHTHVSRNLSKQHIIAERGRRYSSVILLNKGIIK